MSVTDGRRLVKVLAILDQQDRALERTQGNFEATAARVYLDPAAAIAQWAALVLNHRRNLESAAAQVRTNPEILGPLLTEPYSSIWGQAAATIGIESTRAAKEAVPQMLRRAVLHTQALRDARKPVEWAAPDGKKGKGPQEVRALASTVVEGCSTNIKTLEEKLEALGGVSGHAAWAAPRGITETAVGADLVDVLGRTHRAARVARGIGEGPRGL